MTANRADAARQVLAEINDWCARNNAAETLIGRVLFLHPGFVGLLRKRLQLSEAKETIVRRFLAAHPNGYCGDARKVRINVRQPRAGDDRLYPRVDRDPCPRCGIRADIGCAHSRGRIGTAF